MTSGRGWNAGISDDRPALAEERRQRIAEAVASRGRVILAELVKDMGVTAPTIRRDLDELQHRRLLRRTHGGAIAIEPGPQGTPNGPPMLRPDAEDRIAAAVLAHIRPGMSIFLDGGSIFELIAERLPVRDVSILTNSFGVARLLADRPGIRHTLIGGEIRRDCGTLVGPLALETLGRFTFDIAVLGAGGLTGGVVSVSDVGEALIKRSAVNNASHVILAMDSSKFGRREFVEVGRLDCFDLVVTDRATHDAQAWCDDHRAVLEVTEEPHHDPGRPAESRPLPAPQKPDSIQ